MEKKKRELIQLEKNLTDVKTQIRIEHNNLLILRKKTSKLKKLIKEYVDSDILDLEEFLKGKYYTRWKYNLEEDEEDFD